MRDGKRGEEDAVEELEDAEVCADAEGEGEDDDCGEGRGVGELAKGVAEVGV
jgi:hypothetical protein